MDRTDRWNVRRARGPLAAGALIVLFSGTARADTLEPAPPPLADAMTAEPPAVEVPPDRRAIPEERPRLLPSAFSPLERSADALMSGLLRLLPSGRHLPNHLRERDHDDYPLLFRWMPRSWTTFGWGRPEMMMGNQDTWHEGAPKPIGRRGTFQISRYPDLPPPLCWLPLYVAATTPNGIHVRLGARWDDVDSYVQFPSIAWKRRVE